jgi:hypothetical protein
VLWEGCSDLERRTLKVIAARSVGLSSRDAEVRFGLIKGSSAAAAVRRLAGDGHLIEDHDTRSGWRVVDPLLGAWLREEE